MPEAILAIELSQRNGSVALRARAGGPIDERAVPPADDAHDHLMAVIDAAFRAGGLAPSALRAVAVSIGPGGFTGLRVACATAKAIADCTGATVVAVPSALVVARTAERDGMLAVPRCTVLLASKRDDAWCTAVELADGRARVAEQGLRNVGGLAGLPFPFIGDAHVPPAIASAAAPHGGIRPARWSAAACLEVAEAMLARGESVDPLELLPIYPRPPEAVALWEARHGAG